jgi:predicted enzyme related to lactoylglutathione lyase
MPDTAVRGRFVWYDLMTSDPDAAVGFYDKVIGWGTTQWEGSAMPYTMWTAGETPIGGVMEMPQEVVDAGAPPHWIAYIGTPDVDATVSQAEKLGGHVLKAAMDIPTVGRFAVLADPQGAVFCVFTPDSEVPGHEGPPRQGEFSWHELATTDHEAAFKFYNALFGWDKTDAMDMGEAGMYQMYGRKGMPLGGMFNKPAEIPGPPFWLLYAMVDDVHKTVEKVKEHGGQILNGPMEVPGGDLIAQCMDPQGAAFAIHSHKQAD